MTHRIQHRLRFFQHNPSGPHVTPPIVDHVVLSGTAIGFVGDTAQLTATAYDSRGNVVTGVEVIWTSSQPTWVSVVAGLCTFLSPGTATITATVDGRAYTAAATAAAPLSPTLDWAPLVRRGDLIQPAVFVPYVDTINGPASGYQLNLFKHQGCNTLGVSRAMFPKSASEWGGYAEMDALMAVSAVPAFNDTHAQVAGPYDNTAAWSVDANLATGSPTIINPIWKDPGPMDAQELSTWKRGFAVAIKAKTAADIGKSVRIGFTTNQALVTDPPWGGIAFLKAPSTFPLTADWSFAYIEFDNYAQFSAVSPLDIQVVIGIAQDATSYVFAPFTAWNWHAHETNDPSNWGRPLPWHEELGLFAQFQTQNAWGPDSDLPTLYSGATRASTAVAAPDSPRHYGGRTLSQYTLAAGQGITTDQPYRCEHALDHYPSGEPTGAIWLHWYLEAGVGALPADGALQGSLVGLQTGTTYGPVALTRDGTGPLSRFYRCRIPVNQQTLKTWPLQEGAQSPGPTSNYRFVTQAAHNYVVGDRVTISGYSVPSLNGVWTIAAIPGGVTFEIVATAASGTGGNSSTGDLDFTPRVVNASGQPLVFNAYRAAMTAENPRSYGYHHALVPKRCVTAPVYNDAAFEIMPHSVPNLSVEEGIWVFRHVPIFGLTDIVNLNGNASDFDQSNYLSPGLWQTGPLGSAQTSFACDVNRSTTPGCIDIVISADRGFGSFVQWNADLLAIPVNAATFPRLVAFDIVLAWKNHAVVAFGIGHGPGTDITWLNNGDMFLGGTVSITSIDGATWNLDADGDSHMGVGADRDAIRETGGWTQAMLAAGTGSVNPSTVKGSIEAHLISRLGARQDYR